MTHPDPAVEAAFRVWLRRYGWSEHRPPAHAKKRFEESMHSTGFAAAMVEAAREALNPTAENEDEDDYPVGSVQG